MSRSYAIGFALAVVLTAIPFGLVATKATTPFVSLAVIAILAVVQMLVHLRYFLHLQLTKSPRENLVAIGFAMILIIIMVGGSLWIMMDLHYRMGGT